METHHLAKGFEDQKYSYIVFRKGPRPSKSETTESYYWPRIIRRPLKRSGHIIEDYCDTDGINYTAFSLIGHLKRTVISKSQGKEIYTAARKSKWGDLWPFQPNDNVRPIETLFIKPKRPSNKNS